MAQAVPGIRAAPIKETASFAPQRRWSELRRFSHKKVRFQRGSIHGLLGAACVATNGLTPFWAPPVLTPQKVVAKHSVMVTYP